MSDQGITIDPMSAATMSLLGSLMGALIRKDILNREDVYDLFESTISGLDELGMPDEHELRKARFILQSMRNALERAAKDSTVP